MVAPISLCMITRNEAPRIRRCLESIRSHVAEICVADNGSTDGTLEVAKDLIDRSVSFYDCNEGGRADGPIEDFSMLREKSFSLATQPWTFWIDGDDVVEGGERLEELCRDYGATPSPAMVMLPYEYSRDHLGNVTCLHFRERLVRTGHSKWLSPIHEAMVPIGPAFTTSDSRVKVVHLREGKEQENRRNLRIIEKWFVRHGDRDDVRLLYYAGLEYGGVGDLGKAIDYHTRYVALSGWDDEKCLACLEVSRHHVALGNLDEAESWALKAAGVHEGFRETWFQLGRVYYARAQIKGQRRDWERAASAFRRGLAMPETNTALFTNPMDGRFYVHQHQVLVLSTLGAIDEALAVCDQALSVVKDDANFLHNKRFLETVIGKRRVEVELQKLEALGKIRQDYGIGETQAWALRNILAGNFKNEVKPSSSEKKPDAPIEPQIAQVAPITGGDHRADVVVFTGGAYERWNPETLERGGMGGSETMAWEMTRRLARKGNRVRVYGDCQGLEGTFEGVEWIDHTRFVEHAVKCDVLVSSRIPELVDYPFEARARVAWVHDVHLGPGLTNKRALKFDRYLCLSSWHRGYFLETYRYVHPSAVVVTRNGVDLSRYEASEVRDPHRAIYSSSPDRGLQTAIKCMPAIRSYVPDATLHVFYGFDNWEKNPDPVERSRCQQMRELIRQHEPFGVVFRGRVSGRELAREQLKSGVLAYPTWFFETNFITGQEAQAAGLRIVTSPIAAINETVGQEHAFMIPGDWLSSEYARLYIERVVECMLEPEGSQKDARLDRERQKERARRDFGLDPLADEWDRMLKRFVSEVADEVVPRYRAVGE